MLFINNKIKKKINIENNIVAILLLEKEKFFSTIIIR